jgi:hypothetical protein
VTHKNTCFWLGALALPASIAAPAAILIFSWREEIEITIKRACR